MKSRTSTFKHGSTRKLSCEPLESRRLLHAALGVGIVGAAAVHHSDAAEVRAGHVDVRVDLTGQGHANGASDHRAATVSQGVRAAHDQVFAQLGQSLSSLARRSSTDPKNEPASQDKHISELSSQDLTDDSASQDNGSSDSSSKDPNNDPSSPDAHTSNLNASGVKKALAPQGKRSSDPSSKDPTNEPASQDKHTSEQSSKDLTDDSLSQDQGSSDPSSKDPNDAPTS